MAPVQRPASTTAGKTSRCAARLRLLRVLLVEAIDPAGGIHQLLLAGEERMAVRADVDAEVAAGRERVVDRAACAGDVRRAIVGMTSCFFHGSYLVTGRNRGSGEPVSIGTRRTKSK